MAEDQLPPPRDTVSEERYGPRVHRSVHHGAILLVVGALVFIGAMVVSQIGYGASYSLRDNMISDLGTAKSPWHLVFNVGIVVMGLLTVFAVLLLRTAFPARRSRTIGLTLVGLMGVGSIGVGLSPSDYNLWVHGVSAVFAFLGGSLGLIVLGIAMFRDTRWNGFRGYTLLSGLVALVAFFLFLFSVYLGLGSGGMERLIVAPFLLWGIVAGVHLARIPTFAPRAIPKGPPS